MDTYTYEAPHFYRSMCVTKAVHSYLLKLWFVKFGLHALWLHAIAMAVLPNNRQLTNVWLMNPQLHIVIRLSSES
jgi:hypothetical protein